MQQYRGISKTPSGGSWQMAFLWHARGETISKNMKNRLSVAPFNFVAHIMVFFISRCWKTHYKCILSQIFDPNFHEKISWKFQCKNLWKNAFIKRFSTCRDEKNQYVPNEIQTTCFSVFNVNLRGYAHFSIMSKWFTRSDRRLGGKLTKIFD